MTLFTNRLSALGVALALLLGAPAGAQPIGRPGDQRLPEPEFEPSPEALPQLLPALPPPDPADAATLSSGPLTFVEEFRITGSSVFSDEQIQEVLEPYTGREISSEELIVVRNAITALYVEHGYVSSGAVIPDQDVADGVVEIEVVEGTLGAIEITGNERYRAGRLRERVARGVSAPLNVRDIEERLKLLQRDPGIERVNARLDPGEQRGRAVLRIEIEESTPYRVSLQAHNYQPPSVGAYGGEFAGGFTNLLGFSDQIDGVYNVTEGLAKYELTYALPLNARGTKIVVNAQYSDAEVVESPFNDLDIENTFQSYGIGIFDPVYETPENRFVLGARAEWRRSRTTVLGDGFSFPGTGTDDDGRATAAVLRFSGEWIRQDRDQVIAARSLLSVGLNVLGATENQGDIPDGEFVAWLGQVQWARRFEPWGVEAIFRTDVQISNDPLLSMEQFPVGGHSSIRGYRENQLVRDQGVVASIEFRIPIWKNESWGSRVQLAPFFDIGRSWNHDRDGLPELDGKTLASVGVGLRWEITRFLDSQVYWGHQIDDVDTGGDLQDDGVQFLVSVDFP